MPASLNWEKKYLWVVPVNIWCMPPHVLSKREEISKRHWVWDYSNGRIKKLDEILDQFSSKHTANKALQDAENTLEKANMNPNHYFRRSRAVTASSAFFQLFLANTGMNLEEAVTLTWHDDFKIVIERQGFRKIKSRAGYKTMSFEIQAKFITSFKKYLKLRNYLLENETCDLLFFSRGRTFKEKPARLPNSFTTNFTRTLRGIDPLIPNFGPRQWRANKSDWLVRNYDHTTAASILQNKESTLLKHYAAGSESKAIEEMGSFFEQLSILKRKDKSPSKFLDTGVGGCSNYGHAQPAELNTPIQPNCQQPEGCLFCQHYFLHSDETDARKLISCRYCIYQTAQLSASPDHFDSIFAPVLIRIEQILGEIKKLGKSEAGMIDRVITEVEEDENLSPYWENKLQMLLELGVVHS
jgi:integrase